MDLSVVIPVYNERASLGALLSELTAVLDEHGLAYEVICIDDGSTDGSDALLRRLSADYPALCVIQLRRNFGQTAAMQAGFDAARGDVIVPMDADLQYDPADIPRLLDKLADGHDLVSGWRSRRRDRFLDRRLPSLLANRLIGALTGVRLHDYGCTIKAIRRDLVKELKLYGELHRFIPAVAALVGARSAELQVNHRPRRHGSSNYGIGRTVRVLLDLLTVLFIRSYLARPIQIFGLAGLLSGGLGTLLCGHLAVQKLVYQQAIGDRPLLMLGVLLILVGVQLLSIGLVAEVVARTYHEAQGKAPYHVRSVLRDGVEHSGSAHWTSSRPPVPLEAAWEDQGARAADTPRHTHSHLSALAASDRDKR